MASDFKKLYLPFMLSIFLITGCERKQQGHQGYIEARLAYISVIFPGILTKLYVQRGDHIVPNQLLFELEEQPQSSFIEQAKADLENALVEKKQAEQDVAFYQLLFARRQILIKSKAVAIEEANRAQINYQNALSKLDSANTKIAKAKAQLSIANWAKTKKTVHASMAGQVFDTYFIESELVPQNEAILSLLIPTEIKVIFFVSESELSHIHVGQTLLIKCDGTPKGNEAKISFISPRAELTPPVIYSENVRKKFVFRVEGVSASKDTSCYHPGQPVIVNFSRAK